MSKSFGKIIVLVVIISSLIYKLSDLQERFRFTVKEWESIVSAILEVSLDSNLLIYDLNNDGSIDIRDLCVFYSGLTDEDNKKFPHRNFNTLEAIIFRHQNSNCIVSKLIIEVRGGEEEHCNKHFYICVGGKYSLGNYIKEYCPTKYIECIPPLRC